MSPVRTRPAKHFAASRGYERPMLIRPHDLIYAFLSSDPGRSTARLKPLVLALNCGPIYRHDGEARCRFKTSGGIQWSFQ